MEYGFPGQNRVEVDLRAIRTNLRAMKEWVGRQVKVMAVVKADAYGHGIIPVSRALEEEGVDFLGVFDPIEVLGLRKAGIRTGICLMAGVQERKQAELMLSYDVVPTITDMEMAECVNSVACEQNKTVCCFLKVDTGMGRLGVFVEELRPFLERFNSLKGLRLMGLFSHLSSADETDTTFTMNQIRLFAKAVEIAKGMGYSSLLNSLSNSAGALRFLDSHFQMVRVGIFLYGALPADFASPIGAMPAMTLKGKVLQVRELPPETPVSYCRTYQTTCPTKVAVVSIGYADGIPRRISNRGYCLIKGKMAPIIGNVCMNMTICNVEGISEVKRGEEVVFLGRQGDLTITPGLVAKWADTIPYEILCSIGSKNERSYRS